MEIKELQRMHGGQTTLINIDYYEQLKRKADAWDDKETGKEVIYDAYGTPVCCNCLRIMGHAKYCAYCGFKMVWEE